jgi:hypothetical protein
MVIPPAPQALHLPIVTYWDGVPCVDPRLHGLVTLCTETTGLRLTASLPHQAAPCLPAAPPLTRVANLWEYDVVECFIVGTERYLEVELGAGGHFLALEFSAPRCCVKTYDTWQPRLTFEPTVAQATAWRSSLLLPWEMVPAGIRGVNAYVIGHNSYLCYAPLPGPRVDFHQPQRFPAVRLTVSA